MTAYGDLATEARSQPERFEVTHGEPGAWNVLKTPAGFVIVDWGFVQLAPPERDLWELAQADRSVLAAYTRATGTAIDSGAPGPVGRVGPLGDDPFPALGAGLGAGSPGGGSGLLVARAEVVMRLLGELLGANEVFRSGHWSSRWACVRSCGDTARSVGELRPPARA
jgi:hypothetical protein